MKVVFSPKFLEFGVPYHPESPQRLRLIIKELKKSKKFQFVSPQKASISDLKLAHSDRHIKSVKESRFFDPDTPNVKGIFDYAILAVGGTILASQIAKEERYCFAAVRPPGHHASRDKVAGFCYFNNMAISAKKLTSLGLRVAILDIDVHHGDGTESIVKGDKDILFVSIHQHPLYPGTGISSFENCFNFPLPPYSNFKVYKEILSFALKKIDQFKADILGVSVGFDTHKADSLANIQLEVNDYLKIGKMIGELQKPLFLLLEGGYSKDVGKCCLKLLNGCKGRDLILLK